MPSFSAHPAYAAERAKFAARPRNLTGKAAMEFVESACAAADADARCDRRKAWRYLVHAAVSAAKTTAERVAALRAARALGLKRLELYTHPEDWPAIKALAEKLQRKRAKMVAKRAP